MKTFKQFLKEDKKALKEANYDFDAFAKFIKVNKDKLESAMHEPFVKLAKKFSSKAIMQPPYSYHAGWVADKILSDKPFKTSDFRVSIAVGEGVVYIESDDKAFNIGLTNVPFTINDNEKSKYADAVAVFSGLVNTKNSDMVKAFKESIENIRKILSENGF